MAIPLYLAMTAQEYAFCEDKPAHLAWMACHFSPYGTGITNLPPQLPAGSAVILNDRTPIRGHDPDRICNQLKQIPCSCLVLDFQRPDEPEAMALIEFILHGLSVPVGVSEIYAKDLQCPIFLPPVPPNIPIEQYLRPYTGREIWLEAALDSIRIIVNETSSHVVDAVDTPLIPTHIDEALCCSYSIECNEHEATFTLNRRASDLQKLLNKASTYGVTTAFSLYQEWHSPDD